MISAEQYAREIAAFGIRMTDGVDLREIQQLTGIEIERVANDAIEQGCREGLMERDGKRVRLTEQGVLFADLMAGRFL